MKKLLVVFATLIAAQVNAGVTISDCKILEPAPNVNRTALFFKADYKVTDEILALRMPADESILGADISELSDTIELHESSVKDGVMRMERISKIQLKPDEQTVLKRGGLHIMLMDLKHRPVAGETYPVNIWMTFIDDVQCDAAVVKVTDL